MIKDEFWNLQNYLKFGNGTMHSLGIPKFQNPSKNLVVFILSGDEN